MQKSKPLTLNTHTLQHDTFGFVAEVLLVLLITKCITEWKQIIHSSHSKKYDFLNKNYKKYAMSINIL